MSTTMTPQADACTTQPEITIAVNGEVIGYISPLALQALDASGLLTPYDSKPQRELREQADSCFCGDPRLHGDFCAKHVAEMLADPGFAWSWSKEQCTQAMEAMCYAAD